MIEDDPGVAKVMRDGLSKDGLEVLHFAEGTEAMNRMGELEPQIVLLDITLPGVSGWKILQGMRTLPSYAHVPIIIVTGDRAEESVVKGFKLGADDYIEKPFSLAVLRARVRHQLLRHAVDV